MLSENIRTYRKANHMSQDELAEKLNVSRQSVSLWETGQTQPSIENIVTLAKIFGISTDQLLDSAAAEAAVPDVREGEQTPAADGEEKSGKRRVAVGAFVAVLALLLCVCLFMILKNVTAPFASAETATVEATDAARVQNAPTQTEPAQTEAVQTEVAAVIAPAETQSAQTVQTAQTAQTAKPAQTAQSVQTTVKTEAPVKAEEPFDLFSYCKDFVIQIGRVNGDYTDYQQPATLYGGYDGEYFSMSYWGDSDMVEFCLHCPLSEKQSVNFYLRMRGGYDGTYEYATSKYDRATGVGFRDAFGRIDPAVFSTSYPLSCDSYYGAAEGQNEFMEESRVGLCDLVACLKNFVRVEGMECDFSAFGFVNF
ncbi:MAG: helix-turn-helix domain-containing protein [Clostridia bacterium]|nr:helix-turn-helix domain-containing protein [Clostridia bacterium]